MIFTLLLISLQESDKLADDDLFKFLFELKKPTYVLKKLKSLSGKFKNQLYLYPVCIIRRRILSKKVYPEMYELNVSICVCILLIKFYLF